MPFAGLILIRNTGPQLDVVAGSKSQFSISQSLGNLPLHCLFMCAPARHSRICERLLQRILAVEFSKGVRPHDPRAVIIKKLRDRLDRFEMIPRANNAGLLDRAE